MISWKIKMKTWRNFRICQISKLCKYKNLGANQCRHSNLILLHQYSNAHENILFHRINLRYYALCYLFKLPLLFKGLSYIIYLARSFVVFLLFLVTEYPVNDAVGPLFWDQTDKMIVLTRSFYVKNYLLYLFLFYFYNLFILFLFTNTLCFSNAIRE